MYLDFNGRRVDFNLTSRHAVAAVITALVITVGVLAYLLWVPRERVVTVSTKTESAVQGKGPRVANPSGPLGACDGGRGLLDDDNVCWPCEKIRTNDIYIASLHGCAAHNPGPNDVQADPRCPAGAVFINEQVGCSRPMGQVEMSQEQEDAELRRLLKKKRGY
jgi:hypothetical protein